jgi:hypothetical protein
VTRLICIALTIISSTMADHADSEDDEELKLAIALSLQAANSPAYGGFGSTILSNPPTARREDIEDEGDDDLKLAIELSLQAATSPARDGFESSTESYPPTPNREATPGIDRKAMAGRGSNRKAPRTLPCSSTTWTNLK